MTTKYMGDGVWVRRTNIDNSDIMVPVDIQGHHQETIQTQSGVVVTPSSGNASSWIDAQGFDSIGITYMNDASTNSYLRVYWSNDGTNQHGDEPLLGAGTDRYRGAHTQVKARYFKVVLGNSDTAPHTMSAWAYLKA